MNQYENVKQLRLSGMTYKEIGFKLGISTPRVHQIYKKYRPISLNLRKEIVQRDNHACTECESKQHLQVHHIDGNSHNNNFSNLITLCRTCHKAIDKQARKESRDAERKWMNENWHLLH